MNAHSYGRRMSRSCNGLGRMPRESEEGSMKWRVALVVAVFIPLSMAGQTPGLDPGVGTVHFPVSTTNVEAQRFFDQGMAYLYGFNHGAAIRSFREAAKLDPH